MYPWVHTVKYKIGICSDQQQTGKSCSDLQENKCGHLIVFMVFEELYNWESKVFWNFAKPYLLKELILQTMYY